MVYNSEHPYKHWLLFHAKEQKIKIYKINIYRLRLFSLRLRILKSRSKEKVKIKTAQHGNIEQSYKLLFCFLSNFTCHWVQNIKQTPIFLNTLTERLVNGLCWQAFWLGFVGLLDDRSSSLEKRKFFSKGLKDYTIVLERHTLRFKSF